MAILIQHAEMARFVSVLNIWANVVNFVVVVYRSKVTDLDAYNFENIIIPKKWQISQKKKKFLTIKK